MTETPEGRHDHASTVGETGGLPGRNAAPQTGQLSEDEMADTVSGMGAAGSDTDAEPEAAGS